MNARYEKNFSPRLETVVRADQGFAYEDCDGLPLHASQLTACTAHALRVLLKPNRLPVVPGFSLSAMSRPVNFVGGDYFNFQPTIGNQLGVLLFDVSGKGPEAALIAARLRAMFRAQTWECQHVKDVMLQVNDLLAPALPLGHFATALYGVLDPLQHRFTFARAGHEPLVRIRDGQTEPLAPQGLPLGVGSHEEFADALECQEIALECNDRLFLYTDGLTEARNKRDDEFGLDRVLGELRASQGDDVNTLTSAVSRFSQSQPQHDDLTMISIRCLS